MTALSADTMALRFYVRLRDNADAYHRGVIGTAHFLAVKTAIWCEVKMARKAVAARVRVLLIHDLAWN